MIENVTKEDENNQMTEKQNGKLIFKTLANYKFQKGLTYKGNLNKTLFFSNHYPIFQSKIQLIVISQSFCLNRQVKVLKKCNANFENIAFMNRSNEFIALINYQVSIYTFNNSCNFNICKTILSYDNETKGCFDYNQQHFCLEISSQDDLLVSSYYKQVYFLQKGVQGSWNLIQKIVVSDGEARIENYILNKLGNILILQCSKEDNLNNFIIYSRKDGEKWMVLKEIEINGISSSFCFIDNEKFAFTSQNNISIYNVNSQSFEVRPLQDINFPDRSLKMIFMEKSQLLIAISLKVIYIITQNKNQSYSVSQAIISNIFANIEIIHDELIIYYIGRGEFGKILKILNF